MNPLLKEAQSLLEWPKLRTPEHPEPHTLIVLSGGMDSTALMYHMRSYYRNHFDGSLADIGVSAISFNYGQRHSRELQAAYASCHFADIPHMIVDISTIGALISNSALTSPDIEVPEGMYDADNMAITVVPNRNSILMNIAAGYAVNIGANYIASGMHSGDHAQYPDCRREFTESFNATLGLATDGEVSLLRPFVNMGKHHIVALGEHVNTPWQLTHTCYKNEIPACGRCGTCVERIEAFALAGISDLIDYDLAGSLYALNLLLGAEKITPEQAQGFSALLDVNMRRLH